MNRHNPFTSPVKPVRGSGVPPLQTSARKKPAANTKVPVTFTTTPEATVPITPEPSTPNPEHASTLSPAWRTRVQQRATRLRALNKI